MAWKTAFAFSLTVLDPALCSICASDKCQTHAKPNHIIVSHIQQRYNPEHTFPNIHALSCTPTLALMACRSLSYNRRRHAWGPENFTKTIGALLDMRRSGVFNRGDGLDFDLDKVPTAKRCESMGLQMYILAGSGILLVVVLVFLTGGGTAATIDAKETVVERLSQAFGPLDLSRILISADRSVALALGESTQGTASPTRLFVVFSHGRFLNTREIALVSVVGCTFSPETEPSVLLLRVAEFDRKRYRLSISKQNREDAGLWYADIQQARTALSSTAVSV